MDKWECQRCGKCCIAATFNYIVIDKTDFDGHVAAKDMGRWLALHGCDVGAREVGDKMKYYISIPILCLNLGMDDNTKKYFCGDYKNRPDVCKKYSCEKTNIITPKEFYAETNNSR